MDIFQNLCDQFLQLDSHGRSAINDLELILSKRAVETDRSSPSSHSALSKLEKDLNNQVTNEITKSTAKKNAILTFKDEIEILNTKKETNLQKLTSQQDNLDSIKQQQIHISEAPQIDSHLKAQYLEKEETLFKKHLSLDIKRIKGGNLQFVFTHIDDKDPNLFFTFTLALDDRRKYSVPLVEPHIPGIEELVNQLNCDNNLDKFVHTIRRKFKSDCLNDK